MRCVPGHGSPDPALRPRSLQPPFPNNRYRPMPSRTESSYRLRPVMHVINGQHYSGAERVQDLLASRLPESGYEVSFCCVKPERFPEDRVCKQAALYPLPMRSRVDMRPAFRLASIVKRGGYALLHAHTPRSLIVARVAAMLTGRPLIYHVHSPTARDSTRTLQNWMNNTSERFSLAGVNRLDRRLPEPGNPDAKRRMHRRRHHTWYPTGSPR